MKSAMERMDRLLAEEIRKAAREDCACCLGGKCLQMSKDIARNNESLDERISAANSK